jgi:hypothetical protein
LSARGGNPGVETSVTLGNALMDVIIKMNEISQKIMALPQAALVNAL